MAMDLKISSKLLDRIVAGAAATDLEICGLLIGRDDHVAQVLPCPNVAADPRRRFEIDPAALITAHRQARAAGSSVLGHYHSHPNGSPIPSACDAAEAAPDGAVWLIVAGGDCRAWRAVADGTVQGRFDPLPIQLSLPCAADSVPPEERG
jgi:proteasome lid subunit RPN8/RPN11